MKINNQVTQVSKTYLEAISGSYVERFRIIAGNSETLQTYDLYSPIRNGFDTGRSITRASGRALGPGN
jgi:hypothetical protein